MKKILISISAVVVLAFAVVLIVNATDDKKVTEKAKTECSKDASKCGSTESCNHDKAKHADCDPAKCEKAGCDHSKEKCDKAKQESACKSKEAKTNCDPKKCTGGK
jgi:ABC-type nickel/cobalt efflux system permease component RcnA